MATLYVRDIPDRLYEQVRKMAQAQGRSLSSCVIIALEQALADETVRRKRSRALATIRRRRRPLPSGARDSVAMLADTRGQDE
jgi:hypothetical protein